MELANFEKLIKNVNAVNLTDEHILFSDLELYSPKTNHSIVFDSFERLYNYKIDDICIKDLIEWTEEFTFRLDGGRGSGSGAMGGGFNHAGDGNGKGEKIPYENKYPAEFNMGGKNRSYDMTLDKFRDKYSKADIEYGVTVDEQGFVTRHVQGTSTSVAISGNKGEMVIHNHPSGGNFSDTDLITTASTKAKGIVAVGNKKTYSFTKTDKFKSKEFIKAVKKAKWPTRYNYDQGADWWLKKNASNYGYSYNAK